MKKLVLPAIFVVSIIAGRWVSSSLVSPPPSESSKYNYLSCMGEIGDYSVTYKASFFLVKRALENHPDEYLLQKAAWRINRFAFENQVKYFPSSAKTVAIANDVLTNISYVDALYPDSVKVPPLDGQEFPGPEGEYIKKLFHLNEIKKGEPAFRVTYEVSQTMYTCHRKGIKFDPSELKFFIPSDPYLAINYYPEEAWPEVSLPRYKASGRMNPCFRKDMVSSKKKIPVLGFTFGRMPFAKGTGVDGKEYDCSRYYRVGENIFPIAPLFAEKVPEEITDLDFSRFDDLKRPLRASVFFGAMDNLNFSSLDPEEAKAYVKMYFSEIAKSEAEKNLPLQNPRIDKSFSRLLVFLRNLRAHFEPRDLSVDASSEMVQIIVRGKLRQSKKDLELFIHYSPNLPGRTGYEEFENALASRFLTSDILIYDGHSANGKTLSGAFKKISESQDISPSQTHVAYQILGILSCSSNGPYRPEVVPLPAGLRRDIVYGTGEYLDASAYGSLSFIVATDNYLYNQRVPKFSQWASYFQSDNSFLLHNQR